MASLINPLVGMTAVLSLAWGGPVPRAPVERAGPDTTITIRSTGSALEFQPSRVSVRQGLQVRLVYINQSTLPHNLVVARDGNDIDLLGLAALDASGTGYVPLQHQDRMIAHTRLAAPGDTVQVDFRAPPPGEYLFVCLYAGHFNMMVGTLRSVR